MTSYFHNYLFISPHPIELLVSSEDFHDEKLAIIIINIYLV